MILERWLALFRVFKSIYFVRCRVSEEKFASGTAMSRNGGLEGVRSVPRWPFVAAETKIRAHTKTREYRKKKERKKIRRNAFLGRTSRPVLKLFLFVGNHTHPEERAPRESLLNFSPGSPFLPSQGQTVRLN